MKRILPEKSVASLALPFFQEALRESAHALTGLYLHKDFLFAYIPPKHEIQRGVTCEGSNAPTPLCLGLDFPLFHSLGGSHWPFYRDMKFAEPWHPRPLLDLPNSIHSSSSPVHLEVSRLRDYC